MSAHAEFLRAATTNPELASQIKSDFRSANLAEQDLRMLEFVEKLTLYPWLVVDSDIRGLKNAGFSDQEVLHIVLGCSHFNYLNRIADGVGIQFEYQTSLPKFEKPGLGSSNEDPLAGIEVSLPQSISSSRGPWINYPKTQSLSFRSEEPRLFFLVMGLNPDAQTLARAWRTYQLTPSPLLDVKLRARLALYVSGINRCEYSSFWFTQTLRTLGESETACSYFAGGQRVSHLPTTETCLFDFAELLTRDAWKTTEAYIDALRAHGLDDLLLLKVMMLVSYVNFENRVALGLGLPLEVSE